MFLASMSLSACSTDPGLTENALLSDTVSVDGNVRETASASLSLLRPSVDVSLRIMNQGEQPETLFSSPRGACDGGMIVRAWRDVKGKSTLAWVSSAVPFIPCPAHALPLVVAPHASVLLSREIPNAEILGDSLPPDNYVLTASADLQAPLLPAQITAGPLFIQLAFVVPPGTVLDGTWSGSADGIELRMALHWTADSVTGSGMYIEMSPNTNRCGGGTLRGSGNVTLAAARTEDRVVGHMSFDNGWTPPYSAVLANAAFLDGQFMSVDVGPCPMPLGREVQ